MITYTVVMTRPSTNVPFYWDYVSPEVLAQAQNFYKSSPNILSRTLNFSPDGLTFTGTMSYEDESKHQAYVAEIAASPFMLRYFTDRLAYNSANGITFWKNC